MTPPTQADVEYAFREALYAGWKTARGFLVMGLGAAIDSDDLFFPIPDAAHVGDSQHRVDEAVTQAVEDVLHAHFPTLRVIGEEIIRGVNLASYSVAVLDPVDGTAPFRMLGCSWAVVMYLVVRSEDGLIIPVAGLVTSAGVMIWLAQESHVSVGLIDAEPGTADASVGEVECATRKADAPLAIAVVAAKPKDFDRQILLRSAFKNAMIFNLGGNPVVVGLIRGDLDAIVSLSPQTTWDSVYALLVAYAGGAVGAIEEERLYGPKEVLDWFRQPNQRDKKPIPPLIVAKSDSIYRDILIGLQDAKRNQ